MKVKSAKSGKRAREVPRPLVPVPPRAPEFPIDALGPVLGPAAKAISDRVQAALAMSGQSVLAAAALAVQGHANVELPTGQIRPISEFFVSIAESGDRKSSCDELALAPVESRETTLRAQHDVELKQYLN